MKTRFVCLANSFKEGGRCPAGMELDEQNNPILMNGYPKWVRPICKTEHEEVPTNLVSHITVLDIVEIDVTSIPEKLGYQSENVYFDVNNIKVSEKFDCNRLSELCCNRKYILGNKGKAVSEDYIKKMDFSLMLIKTNKFEVIEKSYDDNPNKPQYRLVFEHNNYKYDLPITDPVFLHKYPKDHSLLEDYKDIFISLSLGVKWNDWYYKLVAAIICGNKKEDIDLIDDLPF